MQRWRWGLATAFVAVLGLALVLFLGPGDTPVGTTQQTLLPLTTTAAAAPSTSVSPTSAAVTTSDEQRLAEVELILQELWFGWFDAIYRKDPDALWEVVATTRFHDDGVAAMDTMEFASEPVMNQLRIAEIDLLLDGSDCLVVYHSLAIVDFRGPNATGETVSVLWSDPIHGWRFATDWQSPRDLWAGDCDMEREETP